MRSGLGIGLAVVLAMLPVDARLQAQSLSPPDNPAATDPQRLGDARTEQALRRVLGVVMQQYGELTGKVPDDLNDAGLAMRQALQALDAGNDAAVAAAIRKAIEALQKGGRSMSEQLAQQFGQDQAEDGDEGEDGRMAGASQPGDQESRGDGHGRLFGHNGERGDHRDPLGRPLREDGSFQGLSDSFVHVPDQMEQARAHAIQEELRRREAEKTRPQPELDYIERLLRQF